MKQTWKSGDIPNSLRAYLRRYPETKTAFVISTSLQGETRFQNATVFYRSINQTAQIPQEIERS